jgi:hypothetical protein
MEETGFVETISSLGMEFLFCMALTGDGNA